MLFNSYIFILLFMPVAVIIYFLINRIREYSIGKLFLLLISLLFLTSYSFHATVTLIVSISVNYLLNLWVASNRKSKLSLVAGLLYNVGYLCIFKYSGIIFDRLNCSLGGDFAAVKILLPVGVSFYTFQQIAFLVDNYRGEVNEYTFLDYALFTAFFPKLVQGPIPYHNELISQFNDFQKKQFSYENLSKGLMYFSIGLGKKVLLADNFGKIADYGFSNIFLLNSFEALLTILAYTFQIYLDFSGYSDMAVGVAKMLNINLPQNFNSPYKAKNISDFWKRWHMTLTRFLTKYVYIPLGGNRKRLVRTCINILIVYLVSGLWHGTGFTFIIWGGMHGIATIIYRLFKKYYDIIPETIQWLINFCFVSFTWVFFRAPSTDSAIELLHQVWNGGWKFAINAELTEAMLMPTLINIPSQIIPFVIVILVMYIGTIISMLVFKNSNEYMESFCPDFKNWIATYLLLIVGILSLSGVSTFLYANF